MNNFIDVYHIPTFLVGAAVVPGRTGGVNDPKKKETKEEKNNQ